MVTRDKAGRFIFTTGAARYKRKQIGKKNLQEHRYIWEKVNGPIPKGYVIHHINNNKMDNNLENLKLLSITEHNRIHAHPPWNKGKKAPSISIGKMGHSVSDKQIEKIKITWKNKYINSMMKIHELYVHGMTMEKIANLLNLTYYQVTYRHSKYMRDYFEV